MKTYVVQLNIDPPQVEIEEGRVKSALEGATSDEKNNLFEQAKEFFAQLGIKDARWLYHAEAVICELDDDQKEQLERQDFVLGIVGNTDFEFRPL